MPRRPPSIITTIKLILLIFMVMIFFLFLTVRTGGCQTIRPLLIIDG